MLGARLITTGALWWWGHLVTVPVALYWLVPNIFSNNLNKNNALGWFGLCVNVCVCTRTLANKEKCYPSSSPPPPQSHPSLPSVPTITWHLSPPQIYCLPPTNSNSRHTRPNLVMVQDPKVAPSITLQWDNAQNLESHWSSWSVLPLDMQREIANNRIYEAFKSCGYHFIDNPICGLFSWEEFSCLYSHYEPQNPIWKLRQRIWAFYVALCWL